MVLLTFKLTFSKRKRKYSSTYPFFLWFAFFSCFTILYHFYILASCFRGLFSVLLNQTMNFWLVERLDNLFPENFVKFEYFSVSLVLFAVILR